MKRKTSKALIRVPTCQLVRGKSQAGILKAILAIEKEQWRQRIAEARAARR